ncbi:MAG: hypothetical protein QM783_16380 [Phycisphaerales bacterium]
MNQHNENTFNAGEVAPNPFSGAGSNDQNSAIPTIPGFDMGAASKGPRVNLHGLLTFGIFAVAAVSIWGMRSIGLRGQTGVVAGEISAEMSIDTNKRAVMTVEDQRLLRDLNASRTDKQVPGDELQKNPFALADAARPKLRPNANQPAPAGASDEEIREARKNDLVAALGDFKLQGVMGGTNPVVRINGKAYRVGDTLGDKADSKMSPVGQATNAAKFLITAIEGREITVTAEGFTFILSMDAQ